MMRIPMVRLFFVVVAGVLVGGCENEAVDNPAEAQQTYGAPVDPTDAVPVPALIAESHRYVGRRVTVDGRLQAVSSNGCTLSLHVADGPPLQVNVPRTADGPCTWQVSSETTGFAVAVGRLRAENDTLRLLTDGVQITPLQPTP